MNKFIVTVTIAFKPGGTLIARTDTMYLWAANIEEANYIADGLREDYKSSGSVTIYCRPATNKTT